MNRNGLIAALAAAMLAACGGSGSDADKDVSKENAAMDDLGAFEGLVPWTGQAKGVQETETGLEYIIVKRGPEDGKPPSPRDRVSVMYDGRISATGEKFDSSYDRGQPATFGVTQVIAGWTEGLQLMRPGDEFIFYIPAALAYGDSPRGNVIKAGDDLTFRVELLDVERAPPPKDVTTEAWAAYTPWDSGAQGIQKTGTGLEYIVIEEGAEDGVSPGPGYVAIVHYEGRLNETGETFDSSYARGMPIQLDPTRVIPGWQEALSMMTPGDRWLVHVPGDLAYGAKGTPDGAIPPDAALNFEIELMDALQLQ